MTPGPCTRDTGHHWTASGWCAHGCGWRDDGQSAYRPGAFRHSPEAIDITEPRHPREDDE